MEFLEAVEALKNPNDKFNLDLIAIRVVVLELLTRSEAARSVINDLPSPEKKGKKK